VCGEHGEYGINDEKKTIYQHAILFFTISISVH
jgi:hypothetical protein